MKFTIIKTTLLLFALFPLLAESETLPASAWNLPKTLSDQNAKVSFKVDSTWHTVHGKTSGLHGKAELRNNSDLSSVNVELKIPVAKFNTDNESRDEELREIMNEKEFTDVIFTSHKLSGQCTPAMVLQNSSCEDNLAGTLKIREVSKEINLPVVITHSDNGFMVRGKTSLKWADYNVEDPSIFLVASVDPVVEINFEVVL